MKLTYDPRYNIAYIALRDKPEQVETLEVSDELHIDIAPDGTIYGIELLNANQQLTGDQLSSLVVINEALGETSEIKLSLQLQAS
jgi:uncharacterized protein YuzE